MQSQCCHHVNICSFISFSFVKILLQTTHVFNYLSLFSEIFLFHEITWTKYQKVLIFSSLISWNKKVLSHRWTWNNMSWVCFHCEITWNKRSSSNISSPFFMLNRNENQTLETGLRKEENLRKKYNMKIACRRVASMTKAVQNCS